MKYPYPVVYNKRGKGYIMSTFTPHDRHSVSFCIHCGYQRSFSNGFCDHCGFFYQYIPKKKKGEKGTIKDKKVEVPSTLTTYFNLGS